MKFEATEGFRADYKRLGAEERFRFAEAVRKVNESFRRHVDAAKSGPPDWPKNLRIKSVVDAPGVWELTWSFAGPDGRATFEFIEIAGELAIRWRRIDGRSIFSKP